MSATACQKPASILKDTRGILQSQGSTGYSLYLPGLVPRVISGAAPRKLLSCWKLQSWHPQVVTLSSWCSLNNFSQVSSIVHPLITNVHCPQHAGISELPQHQGRVRPSATTEASAPNPTAEGLKTIRGQIFQSHPFRYHFTTGRNPYKTLPSHRKTECYKTFLQSAIFLMYTG